jgi:Lrp/AsnC family transcriptional regulator, leucine-responsive regulatory protein
MMAKWQIEGRFPLVPSNPRHSTRKASENDLLDPINRRLLAELQEDARVSVAELGRRINLSAPAVAERLQRLERGGVILGYHAEVDPKALGFPLAAVVRVRPGPGQLPRIPEIARDTPEVVECHRITGEDCFFMKLHLRDVEHLEQVLDRFILYGQTTTSIIQSSPVPRRGLLRGPAVA